MLIIMILMRIWLVLSLSAAAPVVPTVDKEAREDTASVDIVNGDDTIDIVNGDDIIDIVNGDDINCDALHSHSSENTNRCPRRIYIGGDVNIDIEGDNAYINIASIFGENASQDDPVSPTSSGCPDGEKLTSECMCGGEICASGMICVAGMCIPVCTGGEINLAACFCQVGYTKGGKLCDPGQGCNTDGTCVDGDEVRKCFSAEGCPLVQNNLITTLLKLKKEFRISFEFQPTQYITGWQNVLFMTTGEKYDKKFALSVKDDGQLYLWFTGQHITTEKKYPSGQWHSVEFSQRLEGTQYFYRVKINGVQVDEVVNNEPNIFSDVKVYASDPWHKALKGSLRNLVITMEKTKVIAPSPSPMNTKAPTSTPPLTTSNKISSAGSLPTSPAYLRVPGFKKCLGSKSEGSSSVWCFPSEKPAACNPTSWEKLMTLQKEPKQRLSSCGYAGGKEHNYGCGFNDNLVRKPKSSIKETKGNKLIMSKQWYKWIDGKIPYYFKGSVTDGDKNLIKDVMNEIEQHTCFEFILHDTEPLGHHLEIEVESGSCIHGFDAYVEPDKNDKILLHSSKQFTDWSHCDYRGGILHEMMHVFGIMHTHRRPDRDQFINVFEDNIEYGSQYEICKECRIPPGFPYECDSIMHYGFKTCAKDGVETMSAKDSSKCHLSEHGPAFSSTPTPTENDWKLLKNVSGDVCGAEKVGIPSVLQAQAMEEKLTSSEMMKMVKQSIKTLDSKLVAQIAPGLQRNPENVKRVEAILKESDFEYLFPKRSPLYTYRKFLQAIGKFPAICDTYKEHNSDLICKKTLTTMFAHFTQETGGHNPGTDVEEWRQGLVWLREMGCNEASPGCGYNGECESGIWQSGHWPCGKNPDGTWKKYFGRGAMQISHNYNYGPFSDAMFGTVRTLLDEPSIVADTWLSFASAMWFFVYPQPLKPSMLFVVDGTWQPNEEDKKNHLEAGFGATIEIINGGIECPGRPDGVEMPQAINRINYYKKFSEYFKVNIEGEQLSCAHMTADPFKSGGSGALAIYWDKNWDQNYQCELVNYQTSYTALTKGDYDRCVEEKFDIKFQD